MLDETGGTLGTDKLYCTCESLVTKPDGNNPLGKSRRKWEFEINMHVQDKGRGRGGDCALDLCGLGYELLGAACGGGNEAPSSMKFWGIYRL